MRVAILLLLSLFASLVQARGEKPLLVYGAASLSNVLQELGPMYTRATGHPLKFSLAASSTLARQIEAGADADLFFSADIEWMDYLQTRQLIDATTRTSLLRNTLVLVAPSDSAVKLVIAPRFPLRAALGSGRLAMADPTSVPAGKYAQSALTSLGVWNDISGKIVHADNVRTALAFVARGEAPFGIVYRTDAMIEPRVRVVDEFPASSHPPITYPIARTAKASPAADSFIAFLRSKDARAVFERFGFRFAE